MLGRPLPPRDCAPSALLQAESKFLDRDRLMFVIPANELRDEPRPDHFLGGSGPVRDQRSADLTVRRVLHSDGAGGESVTIGASDSMRRALVAVVLCSAR